jgi:Holliday junction resolvase
MKIARVDDNQKQIVKFLREKNVTVSITSATGRGFPDLVCGYKGKNILLEIKDGSKPLSAQALTTEQILWHYEWKGQIAVVNSPETAWQEIQNQTRD